MNDGIILPDSRLGSNAWNAAPKGARPGIFGFEVPIFCASCHTPGGYVPEENMTFAFWTCDECFKTYGPTQGLSYMPDEIFFQRVKDEQIEKYGRTLTAEETIASLADPESLESKLARDRKALTPHAGD